MAPGQIPGGACLRRDERPDTGLLGRGWVQWAAFRLACELIRLRCTRARARPGQSLDIRPSIAVESGSLCQVILMNPLYLPAVARRGTD
jgi:hypothetical protein